MSDPSDFVIENGVLKKYQGPGGDVVIPEGVTSIGDYAFYNCSNLMSVTIPEGVKEIGWLAFRCCSSLKNVTIPKSMTIIAAEAFSGCEKIRSVEMNSCKARLYENVFGYALPRGLVSQIPTLFPYMEDRALKRYILDKKTWNKLDSDLQTEIYLTCQKKSLNDVYQSCISEDTAGQIGQELLKRLTGNAKLKDCNTTGTFMTTLHEKTAAELLRQLYACLKKEKNGAKAIETVEENARLMEKLEIPIKVDRSLSPAMQLLMARLIEDNISIKELDKKLYGCYALNPSELPALKNVNAETEDEHILAWLLTAHEWLRTYDFGQPDVYIDYKKPGLQPAAAEIEALLDPASLQAALMQLADTYLVARQSTRKKYLAYPICRYADEATMAELIKRAPQWRSSVSGNDAPPLRQFRDACLYSNTRAALLFAEKMGDLDAYAKVRGTDADTLRFTVLADFGFDENGKKVFDLGSGTVTASVAPDLTLSLFDDRAGKIVKSIPKKGADPEKYEAAKKRLDDLKKNVKKVVKTQNERLFAAFLNGDSFKAADWTAAYTKNPVLNAVARLLVWSQGEKCFTLADGGPVNSKGLPCTITDKPIKVAHPMKMRPCEVTAWQKFFASRNLKQPFAQVWELVIPGENVTENRYAGCMIPYYRFVGQEKHGISVEDHDYHNEICISFKDCNAYVERIDWERHEILMEHRFEVKNFQFKEYTRQVNHIVAYLDRITVWDRVKKDDVSVMDWMDRFTLAQITEFIAAAQETKAVNVLALLLEYKNAHFADFDPMDEFTLE